MQRVGRFSAEDARATYALIGRGIYDQICALLPDDWSFSGRCVLDFGCGAGRVLRHFLEHPGCELYGCDVDEPSIRWIEQNLSPGVTAILNGERPPLPLEDAKFDLIYAASVFTHLDEEWAGWLLEMRRLLRPNGWLIASFLGPPMYEAIVGESWDPDRIGMTVVAQHASWDEGGPCVFHSPWWIKGHWGRAFEIVRLETEGFGLDPMQSDRGHGFVVMRPRAEGVTRDQLERLDPDEPRELAALRENARLLARRERDRELKAMATETEVRRLASRVETLEREHAIAVAQAEAATRELERLRSRWLWRLAAGLNRLVRGRR